MGRIDWCFGFIQVTLFPEKIGKCPFQKKKKIQHFAQFPKLIREIPLF